MLTTEQRKLIYDEIQEMREERDYALAHKDTYEADMCEAALKAIYFVLEVLEDKGPKLKRTLWSKDLQ